MKNSCPLCKNRNIKLVSKITRENMGAVLRCQKCKHVFLDLGVKEAQLRSFIDDFYKNDNQRKDYIKDKHNYVERIRPDNTRRFLTCQKYLNPKQKVLDFGAGYCLFSYLIKPFVSEITVLDKSKLTKENAAKFGLNYVPDVNGLNQRFNLIFAFHTLEHLIDPMQILNLLGNFLQKDGLMVIEVPNHNDLLVKLSKRYPSFYYQVAHLHYFKPKTLKKTLKRAGLDLKEVIPTQRYGLSNHMKWIFNWQAKETPCLESLYKLILSYTPWRDTLFYVLKKIKKQI